jgi:hypothetical protein
MGRLIELDDYAMTNVTTTDTQRLAQLLEHKFECLTQLRDLGDRQLERIELEDMTALLKVLSAKQRLLDELQVIERGLDPFRGQSPQDRRWASTAERTRCGELMARCQQMFSEIVLQERSAETNLIRRRDEAERRLHGMHAAAGAQRAYLREEPWATHSLDLSTES